MNHKQEKLLNRQLEKLERREQKLLRPKRPTILGEKRDAFLQGVQELIPDRAAELTEKAFEKALLLLLEQGAPLLLKSCGQEKRAAVFAENRRLLQEKPSRKALSRFDRKAGQGGLAGQGISAVEGAAFGFLGVWMPDVLVLIGMLLRAVYTVGLDYGFSVEAEAEKLFVLQVLCSAFSAGEERVACAALTERVGLEIDLGAPCEVALGGSAAAAAHLLCERLLLAKTVQGVPLVGAVGGVVNAWALGKATEEAKRTYKKRFLRKTARKNI